MGEKPRVILRLQRLGRLHLPVFRLVAACNHSPRDGKHLEKLGTYHAQPDLNGVKHMSLKVEQIQKWIMRGARMTEPVMELLSKARIIPPHPLRYAPYVNFFPTDCTPKPKLQKKSEKADTA
mmetsp:Transcript_2717/g.5785  ORF Transcript_2717/g.5785 Transcript_2717/m.5785 type:complete len:122 (-) Transcript_2717:474-839(-)|eukprot:2924212-Pleurochrysis_carterae.AAC.2